VEQLCRQACIPKYSETHVRCWNKHVNKGLTKLGFKASLVDSCVYYHGKTTFMIYVDDGIFVGPDKEQIATLIRRMQGEFNIADEGDIKEYLGVLVEKLDEDKTYPSSGWPSSYKGDRRRIHER
jgi:hypothetical protein